MPDTTAGVLEEPILPVTVDRRVVQISTVTEPITVPLAEPMEQAPTPVPEQMIESRVERGAEAIHPEVIMPVLHYDESRTAVFPVEPSAQPSELEFVPGVAEPHEKVQEPVLTLAAGAPEGLGAAGEFNHPNITGI